MSQERIYTVGGAIIEGVYIERKADDELLSACLEGDFAYILTARQMGKSSLMNSTADRLKKKGVAPITIDLTTMGREVTPEQWFLGFIDICVNELNIDFDYREWWNRGQHLGFMQRLINFFKTVLLKEIALPIVVFIDEIDTTLSFSYKDDFFAGIRSIYNARKNTPEFRRLTFVLIGVATPDELIRDSSRTPFNIGRQIELTYFTPDEALPLASGLNLPLEQAREVLRWILEWSAGHPYLTQKLCSIIANQSQPIRKRTVENIVKEVFFSREGEADHNLQFIKKMLQVRPDLRRSLATKYITILTEKPASLDDYSDEITYLRLTGLIRKNHNGYMVSNRIYATVFNQEWILENLLETGVLPIVSGSLLERIDQFNQRAQSAFKQALEEQQFEEQVLARGLAAFVRSLQAQLKATEINAYPYRGLLPYGLGETRTFFGRNQAIQNLIRMVRHNSLVVLHSDAGAGKTSLMEAGIASHLIANGALVLYLRPHNINPILAIKRTFIPESQIDLFAASTLRDFLRQLQEIVGAESPVYIFIDQFEEFFIFFSQEDRRRFLTELADCLSDRSLRVRWLLAVRGEYLSSLAEMEPYGIQPYQNTYRLNRLSKEEAREAITVPAKAFNWSVQPDLVDAILNDLAANNEVDPTQLQLVCAALVENMEKDNPELTTELYQRLGAADRILRNYLNQLIEQRPIEERKQIQSILSGLITSDGRRAIRSNSNLQAEITPVDASIDKDKYESILNWLVGHRLIIRHEELEGEISYELAHDFLVREISLQPEIQARKIAQELLDQETRTYLIHKSLLDEDRLLAIQPFEETLVFSPISSEFYEKSKQAVKNKRNRERMRRNLLLASALIVAAIMAVLGSWGLNQSFIANQEANLARTAEHQSLSAAVTATYALGLSEERGTQVANQIATANVALDLAEDANEALKREQSEADAAKRDILKLKDDVRSGLLAAQSQIYFQEKPDLAFLLAVEAFKTADSYQSRSNLLNILLQPPFSFGWQISHEADILGMFRMPDNDNIFALTQNQELIVWDSANGQELWRRTLEGATTEYLGMGYIRNLDAVIMVTQSQIKLWDSQGVQLETPSELSFTDSLIILDTVINQDGNAMAIITEQDGIIIWRSLAQTITRIESPQDPTGAFALSPSGGLIAVADLDKVNIYETQDGGLLHTINLEGSQPLDLAISPDEKYLAISLGGGSVQIWEIETSTLWKKHQNSIAEVTALAWSSSNHLAVGNANGYVEVYSGNYSYAIPNVSTAAIEALAWSQDGIKLVMFDSDNTISLWKFSGMGPALSRDLATIDISIDSPLNLIVDGTNLISVKDNDIGILDIAELLTFGITGTVPEPEWNQLPVNRITAFSHQPGTRTIVIGAEDNTRYPDNLYIINDYLNPDIIFPSMFISNQQMIPEFASSLSFSPDGKYLAIGEKDGCIVIWQFRTSEAERVCMHKDLVTSLAWSPDGRYLASGSLEGNVFIWELGAPQTFFSHLPGKKELLSPVAFISSSLGVNETPTPTGFPRESLIDLTLIYNHQQDTRITGLAFSPQGGTSNLYLLIWSSEDEMVLKYDVSSLTPKTLYQPYTNVESIAWFPDGQHFVSGNWDKTLLLWDADAETPIGQPLVGHQAIVSSVALIPDGNLLFSASTDGKIMVWDVNIQHWLDAACIRAGRNFSDAELGLFFPGEDDRDTCLNLPLEE